MVSSGGARSPAPSAAARRARHTTSPPLHALDEKNDSHTALSQADPNHTMNAHTLLLALALVASAAAEGQWFCHGIDCPDYVQDNSTDVETRVYGTYSWTSTVVEGMDLTDAENEGFMRLFDYIGGDNADNAPVDMAAPVLNEITPGQGPACNTTFKISFFVPMAYQGPDTPSPPVPSDSAVFTEDIQQMTVAVAEFGGSDKQENVLRHAAKLAEQVDASDEMEALGETFFFAGYDPPFRVTNRHNEVWIPVKLTGKQ